MEAETNCLGGEVLKSPYNFLVKKEDGTIYDMHELGVWVSSFRIYSPNVIRTRMDIPGRPGTLVTSTKEDERHVHIEMQLETDNLKQYDEIKHLIYEIFYSENHFTIIQDLHPDREIRVYQDGEYDINNITDVDGEFFIDLIMADPYIYGPELEITFPSDAVTITNQGTAEADPIFELEVKEPVTFAMIQNQDNEYMMIGKPVDEEEAGAVQEKELVFDNTMSTTTGWTTPDKLENARLGGEIRSNGDFFYPYAFGTVDPDWYYGPALKTSLSEPLNDFMVEATVTFNAKDNPNMAGKLEIALLDESNNVVAVMALKDSYTQQSLTEGVVRIGGVQSARHALIDGPGAVPGQWNGFTAGILRIEKKGNSWQAYIARVTEGGVHHSRFPSRWVDTEDVFTDKKIAQIQISFLRFKATAIPLYRVHHIKVWKLNDLEQNQIPYIADAGDIITFDHRNADILINGENRKDLKQFGASFFKLKKGINQFVVMPTESFHVKCRFRERFL